MKKRIILSLTIIIFLTGACYIKFVNQEVSEKHYSLEELQTMSDEELYKLFVDHGMRVHEDFIENFTEEERIDIFKKQFDHIIQRGFPRVLSFIGHKNMGEDIQHIYNEIIEE